MADDPLARAKETYAATIDRIKSTDSPVGIDAQFTHAVIIEHLRRIERRLDALERKVGG